MITGCRREEAAYVAMHKPIFHNDTVTNLRWGKFDWKITMPAYETKTRVDYYWLIP